MSAKFFRIPGDMQSGPVALCGCSFLSSLIMPGVVKQISGHGGNGEGPKFGTSDFRSSVKALLNCLFKESALPWSVVMVFPW